MSQPRKALTQHAAEIEQWMAQGWLTRQENGLRVLSIDRTSCSRGRKLRHARQYLRSARPTKHSDHVQSISRCTTVSHAFVSPHRSRTTLLPYTWAHARSVCTT